jgi:hypothetical protein
MVIGFDDTTLQPDLNNRPDDIRAPFHLDKIQPLISRYASEPFEIDLAFHLRPLSGPYILDHIRTGGCGCQAMSAKNVGTTKNSTNLAAPQAQERGAKILGAERSLTRERMIRQIG